MQLTHLELSNHRNIQHAVLEPDPHLTVICGPNGQGKTNLLESIWLLTGGKSFRGSKDIELIRRGEEFSVIEGSFLTTDSEKNIRLTVGTKTSQRPGRTARLNGSDQGRAASLAGNFQAVVFEPDLLSLVKGGPEGRRRFLDAALCQIYRPYLVALRRYMRLVAQKNALLKAYEITRDAHLVLEAYDQQLVQYGSQIMRHRLDFLNRLAPVATKNYREISHGAEELELRYLACTPPGEQQSVQVSEDALAARLHGVRQNELRAGYCLAGPHREDIEILLDGQPARIYGSQGQQRSAVLAMKLAEATIIGELFGEYPVMLLDDVLSELDDERQTYLLTRIGEHQTFVTTCDTAAFARTNGKIVTVAGGMVREIEAQKTAAATTER